MPHFIHIPKTGGTSIINDNRLDITYTKKDDLKNSTLEGIDYYINRYRDKDKPLGRLAPEKTFAHARYLDIQLARDSYFTVIRNPWDRMVSKWLYSVQIFRRYKMGKIGPLEEYAADQSLYRYKEKPYTWFTTTENWWDQVTYLENENNEIVTDNLRFEHFQNDLNLYFGCNYKPLWLRSSKLKNKDYKEYYNPKSIQIVADLYKRDIETFGFDFDTSATKNYWNMET